METKAAQPDAVSWEAHWHRWTHVRARQEKGREAAIANIGNERGVVTTDRKDIQRTMKNYKLCAHEFDNFMFSLIQVSAAT